MSIYVRLRVEAVLETAKSGIAALLASFLRRARKTRQSRSEMAFDIHPLVMDADDDALSCDALVMLTGFDEGAISRPTFEQQRPRGDLP
ncbi:hypothetical protein [Neorhizobium galegae]|uniref:hypothetical protein n=1 Tax=Neorhizobium galegae TaxID=399 RepID=UPI00062801F9|nr:hypothetical protein [Neorhizobium galegae]